MKIIKDKKFFIEYSKKFSEVSRFDDALVEKLIQIKKKIIQTKKLNKKVMIFGNGGSAAIASHFSVDLTKNTKYQCMNFSDPSLLTCFSNDYGYENWIKQVLRFYGNKGDLLIVISSGGRSKNIINACREARKKKFSSVITLTGFKKTNPIRKLGDINLWVNSAKYNFVENAHQIWLLSLVDLIVAN